MNATGSYNSWTSPVFSQWELEKCPSQSMASGQQPLVEKSPRHSALSLGTREKSIYVPQLQEHGDNVTCLCPGSTYNIERHSYLCSAPPGPQTASHKPQMPHILDLLCIRRVLSASYPYSSMHLSEKSAHIFCICP